MEVNAVFNGPDDSTFQSESIELIVDKKAGIGSVTLSDIHLIEKSE
jgi:hypothetical protein